VEHIKVVAKQLTGHTELQLKNAEAGALTDATTISIKSIRDDIVGKKSKLLDRRDRVLGAMYSRTSDDHNRKFQVVHSTWQTHKCYSFLVVLDETKSQGIC